MITKQVIKKNLSRLVNIYRTLQIELSYASALQDDQAFYEIRAELRRVVVNIQVLNRWLQEAKL